MSIESAKITITAKRKILKFEEGVEPVEGNEYEVVETEEILTGEQAEQYLKQMGVKTDAIN